MGESESDDAPELGHGRQDHCRFSTMMNKGLEVIEAHYLFGADYDDIDVVVHPQSIIHSAIETQDNSVIAQLGWPDMRLPLLYSVSWPHRVRMPQDQWEPRFDLVELGSMTFKGPDNDKYPCIGLAYAAGRVGGTMTGCLNAANEMANEMFREGAQYLDIGSSRRPWRRTRRTSSRSRRWTRCESTSGRGGSSKTRRRRRCRVGCDKFAFANTCIVGAAPLSSSEESASSSSEGRCPSRIPGGIIIAGGTHGKVPSALAASPFPRASTWNVRCRPRRPPTCTRLDLVVVVAAVAVGRP